jgi:hypothetical protein
MLTSAAVLLFLLTAPERAEEDPVVRAEAGDWGMFFRFGGLSTLTASNPTRDINGVMATQVGLRAVLTDELILPFFFGTGFRTVDPDGSRSAQTDVGADVGAGLEYHFRVWRRISPFIAFSLGLGMTDPTGPGNFLFGLGAGPGMGVEYYVADRVSLIAQYLLTFQLEIAPDEYTGISFSTLSGGALTLVFYF